LDGDPGQPRWVLWGANGEHWIGEFDGREFKPSTPKLKGDLGANAYAAQAYDDLPDKRVVLLNWMNGGKYPRMPFNQQMGFPVELSLRSTPEGPRLVRWPVKEIRHLFKSVLRDDLKRPMPAGRHDLRTPSDLLDIELEFVPGEARSVALELRGELLTWDAAAKELTAFGRKIPLPPAKKTVGRRSEFVKPWGPDFDPWDGSVRMRVLLDRTSVEIFGNGGMVAASFCFVPKAPPSAALVVEGGSLPKARVTVRGLKTAWRP
jgi:sucrose-6-phosphate hydrolase SacC (GH32 family)